MELLKYIVFGCIILFLLFIFCALIYFYLNERRDSSALNERTRHDAQIIKANKELIKRFYNKEIYLVVPKTPMVPLFALRNIYYVQDGNDYLKMISGYDMHRASTYPPISNTIEREITLSELPWSSKQEAFEMVIERDDLKIISIYDIEANSHGEVYLKD